MAWSIRTLRTSARWSGAPFGQVEHLAEDQGRALPGRQQLQRRHQGEADAVPGGHHLGRVGALVDRLNVSPGDRTRS